jgi:hypothetical protein
MSASTPPVTPIQIITKRQDIARADSPADIVQAALNSPQLMAILTETLGPMIRQYGNSNIAGAVAGTLVWVAAHYGVTLPPEVAVALCVGAFVVFSYLYQMFSIWRGKKAALAEQARVTGIPTPVQPAASASVRGS